MSNSPVQSFQAPAHLRRELCAFSFPRLNPGLFCTLAPPRDSNKVTRQVFAGVPVNVRHAIHRASTKVEDSSRFRDYLFRLGIDVSCDSRRGTRSPAVYA